jgi:hypothetical protein
LFSDLLDDLRRLGDALGVSFADLSDAGYGHYVAEPRATP